MYLIFHFLFSWSAQLISGNYRWLFGHTQFTRTFIFEIHLFLLLLFLVHCSHLEMLFKEILKLWCISWHKTFILNNNFMSGMEGSIGTQCKNRYFLRSHLQSLSPCHICFLSLRKNSISVFNSVAHFSISTLQLNQPTCDPVRCWQLGYIAREFISVCLKLYSCLTCWFQVSMKKWIWKSDAKYSDVSVFKNSLVIHLLLTHRFITMVLFSFFFGRNWNIKSILPHGTCTVVFWFRLSKILNSSKK